MASMVEREWADRVRATIYLISGVGGSIIQRG
jgi:hypothetical protein